MFLNSRWKASDDQFAVRINTTNQEIHGLLKNSIVVEPGTRAFVVQEGQILGAIPPGEYTVKSFTEFVAFWRKGQTTVILVRSDIVPFEIPEHECITADQTTVGVTARCAVQISDIGKFLDNLLGPRDHFSIAELAERTAPLLQQALWHAVGSRSLEQVQGPAVAHELSEQIEATINLSLQRYGLKFVDVETVTTGSREFRAFLMSNAVQRLATLKDHAATEKLAADLEVIRQRSAVRESLRDAVQSDRLDSIRTKEEMSQFLLEVNKGRVLRKEELDVVLEEFDSRKDDRQSLREHLVELIDLNRQQEIDQLRDAATHQVRVRSLQSEIELAQLAGDKGNVSWRHELQKELDETAHANRQRMMEVQAKWERIREQQRGRREESWNDLLHRQKLETLREDVEVTERQRQRRIALLEHETVADIDRQKIEIERRRKAWEWESAEKESLSQIERLRQVQEMNLQMQERQERMRLDLDELKQDKSHERDLQRMEQMNKLGTEALIASSNTGNAALLAELKKHESIEQSKRYEAEISGKDELNHERLRMYEKLTDAERAKADAVANAFREAMQGQQSSVQQMISGLAHANSPLPVVPPHLMAPLGQMPSAGAMWYVGINGQSSGPLDTSQLQSLVAQGHLTPTTQVWRPGLANWLSASSAPELARLLGTAPPPSPPAPPPLG